jgi:hypothetical protein
MKEINIQKEDRLLQIINKILTTESSELKISIPAESTLFKNILNLRIFQRVLDSSNIIAKIEAEGDVGKEMLAKVRNLDQDEADFSKYQESMRKEDEDLEERILENKKEKKSFQFPKFSLPSLNFSNLKMIPVFIAGFALVSGIAYYFLVYKNTASVEVLVSSERFVKSFEIKVSSLKNTDVEGKVLKGESVSTVYQATKETPTTGKVDGGKKAEGEIKLLNKTDKTIKLSKDTKVTYKESDKDYNFLILESVEVPGRSLTSTLPETFVSGEKTVEAEASSFGSSYNLSAGKSLSVSGYSSSELSAVVSSSFEGGVKNTLNAVSEQDLRDLSALSFDDFKSNFKFTTLPNKFVLKNSEVFSLASQKFSAQLTEPSDNLKITQDISVSYLVYDNEQALSFVKASIKSLIPEGYELYGKDLQIELNSLGSVSGTNIDSREANVQLTIKSYKIPLIDQEKIKSEIAGKKLTEVSQYFDDLGVGYNIESSNGLLNLLGFPKDLSKINVSITKQ